MSLAPERLLEGFFPSCGVAAYCAQVSDHCQNFSMGRECARKALSDLGCASVSIERDPSGRPVWPVGYCGSISHAMGYAIAVVARTAQILSIGVDIEGSSRVDFELADYICTDLERSWLDSLDPKQRTSYAHLLFSIKESTYKALSPLHKNDWKPRYQDFEVTRVEADAECFEVRVGSRTLMGRFRFQGGLVLTAVVVNRLR